MTEPVKDELFAQHLLQAGIVSPGQLDAARQLQRQSQLPSLAEALIQSGVITPVIRENIEHRARRNTTGSGGIEQLSHYKLLRKLGEGGMGAVYLAQDLNLERKVALKVLPKKFGAKEDFAARFRREAKAAAKLMHPNIVGAYDAGEDLGFAYYVMEFCDGTTLDKKLKEAQRLPPELALEITAQVARGLQYAHQHGFIHRDIKPANLILSSDGTVKILDLGLSKNIGDVEASYNTVSGVALGTPHYISPEQARGDKNVDGRTDIYSLGVTLFHFVLGRPPFEGPTPAVVMGKHLHDPLPDPLALDPKLPVGVAQIIKKCAAKAAAERYADCAELLEDIDRVAAGKPPVAASKKGLNAAQLAEKRSGGRRQTDRNAMPRWIYPALGACVLFVAAAVFVAGPRKPIEIPERRDKKGAAKRSESPGPEPTNVPQEKSLVQDEVRTPVAKAAATPPMQKTGSENVLKNGNFEEMDGAFAAGWQIVWGKQKAVSFEVENGNRFLRLNFPHKEGVLIARRIKLDSKWVKLKVSARLRGKNVQKGVQQPGETGDWHTGVVLYVFYSAQNKKISDYFKLKIDRDQDWTLAESSEAIPAGAAEVEIQCANMSGSGVFDFDDITVVPLEK